MRCGTLRDYENEVVCVKLPRDGRERPLARSGRRREHQRVRILHFSDMHLGLGVRRVPLADWPGKRLAGGANLIRGRGRGFSDAAEKTRHMVRFADELRADLVLCTGDLTALATEAEMLAARTILEPLMESGRFVVIPGNHDLYTGRDVRQRRFETRFEEALTSDLPDLTTDGPWPVVRLPFPGTAVVAVNSSRPNRAPWKSSGRVPDTQVRGLEAALADPRVAGRFVFLMTHYAFARFARAWPGKRRRGTWGARRHRERRVALWACPHDVPAADGRLLGGHILRRQLDSRSAGRILDLRFGRGRGRLGGPQRPLVGGTLRSRSPCFG